MEKLNVRQKVKCTTKKILEPFSATTTTMTTTILKARSAMLALKNVSTECIYFPDF